MEREAPETTIQLLRAIRSLAYNKRLQPLVERRIEQAEVTIRSHLLLQETAEARIGPYEMKLDGQGEIQVSRLSLDDWRQIPLALREKGQ